MSRFQKYPSRKMMPNGFILPEGKRTPNTLFVGGIHMQAEEREIYDYFKKFGLIREVKLITYRGGLCKGYGFVYFDEEVDIQSIVDQPVDFNGKALKLGPAIMKEKHIRSMQTRLFRRPAWMSPPQYIYCSCCSPPLSPMVGDGSPYSQTYSYSSLPGVMIPQMPMSYATSYAQDAYNLQYSPPQYSAPHWPAEQRTPPRLINQNYVDCGVQTMLTLL